MNINRIPKRKDSIQLYTTFKITHCLYAWGVAGNELGGRNEGYDSLLD